MSEQKQDTNMHPDWPAPGKHVFGTGWMLDRINGKPWASDGHIMWRLPGLPPEPNCKMSNYTMKYALRALGALSKAKTVKPKWGSLLPQKQVEIFFKQCCGENNISYMTSIIVFNDDTGIQAKYYRHMLRLGVTRFKRAAKMEAILGFDKTGKLLAAAMACRWYWPVRSGSDF